MKRLIVKILWLIVLSIPATVLGWFVPVLLGSLAP